MTSGRPAARLRIGIDTGGTFTDVVAFDEVTGTLTVTKTPSTPDDPARGFSDGLAKVLALAGAVGWISGYPNAIPHVCNQLYRAATAGDLATALPLYRELHPLLRWDSHTEFVQAIKLSMDLAGLHGGGCRPPRTALASERHEAVKADTLRVLPLEQEALSHSGETAIARRRGR